MKRTCFGGRKLTAGFVALSATFLGLVALAPSAGASSHYCGESNLVHEITVSQWDQGQWQIHVTPKAQARVAPNPRQAVDTMWHAVQACKSGLTGRLADSIYQQLDCHQRLAAAPKWPWQWFSDTGEDGIFRTGNTYDLESWRPKLTGPDIFGQERRSHCLNDRSVLPSGGDPVGPLGDPVRPDLDESSPSGAPVASATPTAQPVYTVMNTSETAPDGVYFRDSAQTADTRRITGLGVYRTEQVQVTCYVRGDAVGPYGNVTWYRVSNVSRPVTHDGYQNVGYVNTHYVDDGIAANQAAPGVPAC
jgi:hypothetical protein